MIWNPHLLFFWFSWYENLTCCFSGFHDMKTSPAVFLVFVIWNPHLLFFWFSWYETLTYCFSGFHDMKPPPTAFLVFMIWALRLLFFWFSQSEPLTYCFSRHQTENSESYWSCGTYSLEAHVRIWWRSRKEIGNL